MAHIQYIFGLDLPYYSMIFWIFLPHVQWEWKKVFDSKQLLKPSYNYLYGPSEIVSAHCDRNMYFWKQKGLVTKFDKTNVPHDKCFVNFNEHDIGL